MFGKNPVRKADHSNPMALRVQTIFATIQGEGPFVGQPAVFIRMAGCNLRCHFCDTDFESNYANLMTPYEVFKEVQEVARLYRIGLVVITGGEPLLQPLQILFSLLRDGPGKPHIQIETAGTVWMPGLDHYLTQGAVSLVCSPKTPKVHPLIEQYCNHWKYIIRAGENLTELECGDGLPITSTQEAGKESVIFRPRTKYSSWHPVNRIYVQPCDENSSEANKRNTEEAVRIAMKFGHTLCLQVHKMAGLE